jgi:hypothetical protein
MCSSGAVQELLVEVDDWSFREGETELDVPTGSAAVMTVSGSVSAPVAGAAKTYESGDYWSVPAGTHMTISIPHRHGAILRTIVASPIN